MMDAVKTQNMFYNKLIFKYYLIETIRNNYYYF